VAGASTGLAQWRAPGAVHDPGKIIADLVMTLALGGDCLADVAVLRAQPQLAGPVASEPVISRLVGALAADRIRAAKDTGLCNLPLHGFAQNQMGCELVAMASELLAWMQLLALDGPARAWEPKRRRLRLLSAAGRLVRGGRRRRLRLAATWPWAAQLTAAITRLQACAPGSPALTASTTRKDKPPGPWNPAHPARQPGNQARPDAENATRPQPQPDTPKSRNIEANASRSVLGEHRSDRTGAADGFVVPIRDLRDSG
jgi:Transposase DDE domain group 1